MRISILLLCITFLVACSNESDPVADKASFTRIYDNNQFNASFYPIDMKETPDGGYLILGGRRIEGSNFSGIYIMKVDAFGAFESETEVDEQFVNPIGPLLTSGSNYYFFGMTSVGLQAQLFQVDAAGALGEPIAVGASYPAAAAQDNSNFVLLSYDNFDKESVISLITPTGSISSSKGFSIGAGDAVEEPIINHFLRTGRQLPFLVGRVPTGQYYFNGFYNYTLSLVFTDINQDEPLGVIQGQQDDGGISQLEGTDPGKYAIARFNFGDNYFVPGATLSTTGVSSSSDLAGNPFPELVPNAPVKIKRVPVGANEVIIYGSNTRSRQIALYGYTRSGELIGSRYLGFSNPFEIASMTATSDGGMAVCGTTYVAGRFPRICLFKLSKEQLSDSFK